ncbi:ParB N-terminal domain-containing protein [Lutimaribacter marinistellae]|uniref:ParB N-terminal domain-containing protein n=1 Tax=Lutimaribacter marinistellae TaxID=1820329 RepID=A0ABV7TEH7_9RHOB
MTKTDFYRIEIFPLEKIRPTEEYSRSHTENLRGEIEITGVWTHPLLIDRDRYALMDGHHRYHAARALGLTTVPVILLSYDDPAVELKSWRPGQTYTPDMIWEICNSGKLLPMKSTRHIIHAQLPFSRVPLAQLRDESHLGQTVTPAAPHPSRPQILSDDYHAFGARMALRTVSAAKLDLETSSTIVPHSHLRHTLETDPAMAALLPGAPCRIALGQQEDFPFRLKGADLLLLPPSLLASASAMSAAARWGMEAAFAIQAGGAGPRRLAALVRHGAALIAQLEQADRSLLLSTQPGGISAELSGGSLQPPSQTMLEWMAGLMGLTAEQATQADDDKPLPLEAPIERVLVSNGDSRLKVDRRSGKNKYGTTPRPRPEAVHFSSSTASSISDYGFLFCDVLRRDLLNHMLDGGHEVHETRAALSDAIVGELRDMCGLDVSEADGVIAPSGTDTEVLAVLLSRAADPQAKLVNILISPEETGRGVKLAGAGRYFDPESATGAEISKGAEIWPGVEIGLVDIGIRDDKGDRLPMETLDREFLDAGRAALDSGARVLAHVLIGSKTGLSGPSDAAIEELVSLAPDRVDVVVDACQMRVDYARLGECVRRGWMVQVSGSKSLTGPPFSGGMLFPPALRDRVGATAELMRPGIGYAEDWSEAWAQHLPEKESEPAFGAAFRWLPALLEAKLLRHVPEALRIHVLGRFRDEVSERLTRSESFLTLQRDAGEDDRSHSLQFARHSIISFQILARHWDGSQQPLDEADCRKIFELLNEDARRLMPEASQAVRSVLSQEFHIGQPVALGRGENQRAVLRLVIGMRFFNIVGHAGPGGVAAALESEISDLVRAIDKLEILAENWWRYSHDI